MFSHTRHPEAGGGTRKGRFLMGRVIPSLLSLLWLVPAGCVPLFPSPTDPNASSSSGTASKPTDNPLTALRLADGDDTRQYRGTISSADQVAWFELGTLYAGDRLTVDVQRVAGNLDPVAAIFDSRNEIVAYNDDRTPDSSDLNPRIDILMPGPTDTYYLGIIAYPGTRTTGDYLVTVQVQRQAGALRPRTQIVYLDWRGGSNITIPNVGVFQLPPFSATQVGLPAEQTAALKRRVQEIVRERYAQYNLLVLSSDDGPPPDEPHSTVYFGSRDASAFAISEEIDTFNADPADDAIVFTESFAGVFHFRPTLEQMAQALGNTVAHEVGHLLGLVHTADCNELMDTTCYNERILSPQWFGTAALDDSIFPFGLQNAPEILSWLLGLAGA
jgi:hypothetical protein